MAPSQQKLAGLHNEFESTALASVSGNVRAAQERLTFADQTITRARELAARPVAGEQAELVDDVRAVESALGQARALLDAVDSAESDIKRAAGMLPSAIADIQNGIAQADAQLHEGNVGKAAELTAARTAASKAVDTAQRGIAVALNGAVVPRAAWPATRLNPGDSVEIVRARQGG